MSIQAISNDLPQPTNNVRPDADNAKGQLDIAIIGAGLVGLATAAMMRREGHRITIFESSSFHAEIGAGITLTPNGVLVLKQLLPELVWENMRTVDLRSVEMFNADGTHTNTVDLSEAWSRCPQGWFMIHRVDLHKELMRLALDSDANAQYSPAAIRLGTPITSVEFDTTEPSVTTANGQQVKFDIILAADGIKSTVRKAMVGSEYDAPASPMAFYRWMVDLDKHPELSWIRDERKSTGPTNVTGKDAWLFMYPLRGGNTINISAAHVDKRENKDPIDWNEPVPRETFLGTFEGFGDKFMGMVNAAEKPRVWQLRSLPKLPTWVKGNVAILGDAAHAMRPTYGQGFAMGLEDASILTTLFPRGTDRSELAVRLKLFEDIRKPRAEYLSQLSTDGVKLPMETLFGSAWVAPELLTYDFHGLVKAALAPLGLRRAL
ncbi:FAD/NAD(P)-binding domain-containing protein [Mycena vitilis]|nr:FAD/NAD(P)-binding domain-containing protein [Mycena vitilis]